MRGKPSVILILDHPSSSTILFAHQESFPHSSLGFHLKELKYLGRVDAADELQGLEELHRGYRGVHHLHCEHRWIRSVAAQGHLSENLRNAQSDNGPRARSSPDERLRRLTASPSCRHHVQRARALHLTSQCTLSDKSVP